MLIWSEKSRLAFTAPYEHMAAPLISFYMGTGFLGEIDRARVASFGGSVFFLLSDLDRKNVLMEGIYGRVFCEVFCGTLMRISRQQIASKYL